MAIGLGIIGLSADPSAWATAIHLGAIKSLPEDYKLVALATSSIESALTAGKVHGVPSNKCYASADALAKDPDVDLVVVSVKVRPAVPLLYTPSRVIGATSQTPDRTCDRSGKECFR